MHTATTVTEACVVFGPGATLMNDSICVTKTQPLQGWRAEGGSSETRRFPACAVNLLKWDPRVQTLRR